MLSSSKSQEPLPSSETALSKKAAKKEAAKQEKLRRQQEVAAAVAKLSVDETDPLAANYGDDPLVELQSKKTAAEFGNWTPVEDLDDSLENQLVRIRGRALTIRPVGKKIAFLVVREHGFTVQCLVQAHPDSVSPQMVKYAASLSRESIVDVEGVVSIPAEPIRGTSQQVEVQVKKLYCVSSSVPNLPFNIEDASRSKVEVEKALQTGQQLVRVEQKTRLEYRVIDLRTPANQGIFRIQSQVENVFRQFLKSEGFIGIHTPKLIAGASEGGSAVFKLDGKYKGHTACLAQSPQLHKQMTVCRGFGKVFEIGPVFRAENSDTHRHLCEFTGLDVEMKINDHSEAMDLVDRLFVTMFEKLNQNCKKELEAVRCQYPFEPLKYLKRTPRLTYEEGVQMLKDAGIEIEPFGDLNTQAERKLGQLVLEKYKTDFYILHGYPLAVRPFYTMPCHDNPAYSKSFDVFIRGEEIISGAQRIHKPDLLEQSAKAHGIDVNTISISAYLDSFRYGAPPHGGFGAGLERVVMLFCGLDNIRKTSLYPRDPTHFNIKDNEQCSVNVQAPPDEVSPAESTVNVEEGIVSMLLAPADQGIFQIQSHVEDVFRNFLLSKDFIGIHTPKLNAGSSEFGDADFRLNNKYKGHDACLAQSPQLHKQMTICGDFGKVFEIGPVFRAKISDTDRYLCESTGLDVEFETKDYFEVMDIVDRLFVEMFDSLNQNCTKDLEAVGCQYPFKPLKYLRRRLTYEEGVQMLKDAGLEIQPFGDLNCEAKRKLGQLVLEKYDTDFYILHRYPLAVRPFYTMPCHDNPAYSKSFDLFIRGEEIISGGQHIHNPDLLEQRAKDCGIDVKTISMSTYIDSFRYGVPPHGGFGADLERIVMLFCGLDNIHKASLYPHDATHFTD